MVLISGFSKIFPGLLKSCDFLQVRHNKKSKEEKHKGTGCLSCKGKTIDQKVVEKARKKGYTISRVDRFRDRCRYFTDSGIIGGPVKSRFAGHFVNFTGQAVCYP